MIDIALEGRVNTDPVNVKNSSHQIKLKAAIFYPENMPLPPDYCYYMLFYLFAHFLLFDRNWSSGVNKKVEMNLCQHVH